MYRKILIAVLTALITVSFTGMAFAMEQGNKRKGKYTYRKLYKACHERGAVEAPKPTINPDAHSQAEWEKIFDDRVFGEFGCDQEWAQLDDKQIIDIFSYLYAHASDSPTPAKCK